MRELGVALLGYGYIGKVHTFGYRNSNLFYDPPPARMRMVAICELPQFVEKAQRNGEFEVGVTDISKILARDDVDIIDICTPNHLHKDALLAAMAAGKHIYCEKPLTGTLAEAQEIEQALPNYKGISQMTLMCRFALTSMRAKQLIEDGFVGDVTQFRAAYLHSGSVSATKPIGWKQQASVGGGVINDLASHVFDLVDWLVGPIVAINADSRILYPERPDRDGNMVKVEAEDAIYIQSHLEGGGIGVIEATKLATGTEDELRVEIHGTRGAIRLNTMQPNYLEAYSLDDPEQPLGGTRGWKQIATVQRFPKPGVWPAPKVAVGWIRSHVHCLHNFVSAVAEGRRTEPSLAEGVRLQYNLEVIRESAAARAWRELPGK